MVVVVLMGGKDSDQWVDEREEVLGQWHVQ